MHQAIYLETPVHELCASVGLILRVRGIRVAVGREDEREISFRILPGQSVARGEKALHGPRQMLGDAEHTGTPVTLRNAVAAAQETQAAPH